jgi:hypothetical protein
MSYLNYEYCKSALALLKEIWRGLLGHSRQNIGYEIFMLLKVNVAKAQPDSGESEPSQIG